MKACTGPLLLGVVVALFSEGSVLDEGVPGLGKTLLVNVLARTSSCGFKRVQFTPDLMPTDFTGHSVYDMNERKFYFNPGPIFTNLLLADDINRPPRRRSRRSCERSPRAAVANSSRPTT